MKKLIVLGALGLFALMGSVERRLGASPSVVQPQGVPGPTNGYCYGVKPFCSWDQHPCCLCDQYGMDCDWGCCKN